MSFETILFHDVRFTSGDIIFGICAKPLHDFNGGVIIVISQLNVKLFTLLTAKPTCVFS